MISPRPFSVTVHPFTSPTPNACAYERGDSLSRNALVFIGGLTSGPHTALALLNTVFQALHDAELGYSVWEFRMRSSFTGFGYSSLTNDVEDIAALVRYLREFGRKKVVLMGSSTGCQGCMEYMNVSKYNVPEVDAYVLQAPTSDRETASMLMSSDFYKLTLKFAESEIARGSKDGIMPKDLIPNIFDSPISVYRWHSLISEGGDDDYFSSDLSASALVAKFSRMNKPTLILPSEKDEMVPPTVDKEALLQKWIQACPVNLVSPISSLVPDSDHVLSALESQQWFADRMVRFLGSLNGS
ncbi:hypothetical protein EKO04_001897 [Ascochyta lentis]|uniref:Uncharacterized protein n=1 Tax=Ascochyta lentis TaxID=205686 RepID=A0A8H7MMU0_9PLEO|nr:hypothetical protein EKO04_001897 [Ascochyta lentis]